jgi:rod shape-determining protein MreC
LLILACLTLLAIGFDSSGPSKGARSAFATVFRPVRSAADAAARPMVDAWHGATRYGKLEKQNERLHRQLDRAKGDTARRNVQDEQVAELKKLLGVKFLGDLPTRTGRVVSGPLSSFDRTIEIDLGSGDGVKRDMAVVTDAGLVGKIVRTDAARSDVSLITDPSFEVGFQLQRTKAIGVTHGKGQGNPLAVDDGSIKPDVKVTRGDDATTSGLATSLFPPDIPIGHVQSVKRSNDRSQQVLQIAPIADLGSLSYVLVILRDPPS